MPLEPARTLIDGLPFLLIPLDQTTFVDKDVLYVVLTLESDGTPRILDVGQTSETGAPPFNDPLRQQCWFTYAAPADIYVGTYRLPSDANMDSDRTCLIRQLREKYHPPCSKVLELPIPPTHSQPHSQAHSQPPVPPPIAAPVAAPVAIHPAHNSSVNPLTPSIVEPSYTPEMP